MGTISGTILQPHLKNTTHKIDCGQIEIIHTADTDKKLLKEMLYINKRKPESNVQKSSSLFGFLVGEFNEI